MDEVNSRDDPGIGVRGGSYPQTPPRSCDKCTPGFCVLTYLVKVNLQRGTNFNSRWLGALR